MPASRLPPLVPSELDVEQRKLYDSITQGRGSGRQFFTLVSDDGALTGPFNSMLLCPPLGDALQRLGHAIRFEGHLTAREREIAILAVAAHHESGFEQSAHEPIAEHAGVPAAQIAAIRDRGQVNLDSSQEQAVLQCARALLEWETLDDQAYEQALAALGRDRLFEVTTVVGYYSLLALQMRVFGVE